MPIPTNLPGYFAHPGRDIARFLYRPGHALQSAEMNGMQDMIMDRMARLAAAQFSEGDIISGIVPRLVDDIPGSTLAISEGAIYLKGDVRSLQPVALNISLTKRVGVGLRYNTSTITEINDSSLRDPAEGTQNFGEAGAGRIKETIQWGFLADDNSADQNAAWPFFPIFVVDHGDIQMPQGPGIDQNIANLIAQYDREAHGNYVVRGLKTAYSSTSDGKNHFDVSAGLANIYGFKVERETGTRLSYLIDYDTEALTLEPHVFIADTNGRCKIKVNRAPVAAVTSIVGVKQKTATVTRGLSANGSDELPDNTITEVLSVTQGSTTYVPTTSYLVAGDNINWAPGGPEPTPGSTYGVSYRYLVEITPFAVGNDYIEVAGLVPSSMVQLSYTRKLPRIDLIVLNQNNALTRTKGQSRSSNPAAPKAAESQIALAEIRYDWVNPPVVQSVATSSVPYDRVKDIIRAVDDLYVLYAQLMLRVNLSNSEPSSKRGVFTDPFIDDDLRDAGATQTGAIVNGRLQLPIAASVSTLPSNNTTPQILENEIEIIFVQENYSEGVVINPLSGVYPKLPALIKLTPAVDRWFVLNQPWTSVITSLFFNGGNDAARVWENILTRTASHLPSLRALSVAFEISGFNSGETLTTLTFDQVNVTPA